MCEMSKWAELSGCFSLLIILEEMFYSVSDLSFVQNVCETSCETELWLPDKFPKNMQIIIPRASSFSFPWVVCLPPPRWSLSALKWNVSTGEGRGSGRTLYVCKIILAVLLNVWSSVKTFLLLPHKMARVHGKHFLRYQRQVDNKTENPAGTSNPLGIYFHSSKPWQHLTSAALLTTVKSRVLRPVPAANPTSAEPRETWSQKSSGGGI